MNLLLLLNDYKLIKLLFNAYYEITNEIQFKVQCKGRI